MLQKLPYELLIKVLKYLHPNSALALLSTNRKLAKYLSDSETWKSLVISRFTLNAFPEELQATDPKQVYINMHFESLVRCPEKLEIAHGNNPAHWLCDELVESSFGHIRRLVSVWWLDVSCRFRFVPCGEYRPICRMKVLQSASSVRAFDTVNLECYVVLNEDEDRLESDVNILLI